MSPREIERLPWFPGVFWLAAEASFSSGQVRKEEVISQSDDLIHRLLSYPRRLDETDN